MWNHSKSLWLTRCWMLAAMILWAFTPLGGVWLVLQKEWVWFGIWLVDYIPILLIFKNMRDFLENINQGKIFSEDNIAKLRAVSWAAFFAAIFLLFGAALRPICVIPSGVIGFCGLLMRVVKNLLAEANIIKTENDYTI